jgi:hypothetical protein
MDGGSNSLLELSGVFILEFIDFTPFEEQF